MSLDDLGEVLAGTPAEMDRAVLDAVGLPYEQFTSCVVLPQGQFADFLHAKPATRQQILVNLLGLRVYEEVQAGRDHAGGEAEAQLAAVDQLLARARRRRRRDRGRRRRAGRPRCAGSTADGRGRRTRTGAGPRGGEATAAATGDRPRRRARRTRPASARRPASPRWRGR